ncbi:DHHC palmitoyltransferase [Hamiltosporidium magnivora]|uniref:Palmitoyltransferase n=1 Tax=Hamiltosporidium magnivora TaxID=148818 RepID=A0A4Q9LKI0_9MICR|nr:DHHC palmitoyltransferase [Hamiltosporidium magnivora]
MKTLEDRIKSTSTLILCFYLHILTQAIYLLPDNWNKAKITYITIFNVSCTMIYIYLCLAHINKGFVIKMSESELYLLGGDITRNGKFCRRCDLFKPERAHHCSRCQKCIKKMDHHCPWIGACVNHDNLGYFIRFLFFGASSNILLFGYLMCIFVRKINEKKFQFGIFYTGMVFSLLLSFSLSFLLTFFFIFTFRNATKNITYIEKLRYSDLKKYGMDINDNPYDRGAYKNIKDVLGKPKFLFLCGEKQNGIFYEKTYPCSEWPPYKFGRSVDENQIKDSDSY